MRKTCGFLALVATWPLYAGSMEMPSPENPWYGSIGTGYSWTLLPGINNPNPSEWDASSEGYNSSLGSRGFYTFEIGKQIQHYVDVSLMYLNHETFNYQMFQEGISSTEGFTGEQRNRYFNLNNRALLVSGFLHPDHNWYKISTVSLSPFIGGGVGYALNQIDNFYTVGTVTTGGSAVGSTSSIGNPVSTNSFAWQATAGLSIRPINHLSLDVGYRYYDGGNFETSSTTYSNTGGLLSATPWAGHLSANQLFVDFKYRM